MKKLLSFGLFFGLSTSVLLLRAADLNLDRGFDTDLIQADVFRAAEMADVKIEPGLTDALSYAAFAQQGGTFPAIGQVSGDARVARLARYFEAKTVLFRPYLLGSDIGPEDVADFHWKYIAEDFEFGSLRLSSPATARLVSLENATQKYTFPANGVIESGKIIVFPMTQGDIEPYVTAKFAVAGRTVLWTGTAESNEMFLRLASTSKGVEIHVNSDPTGAVIYFNGAKWHNPTNERVVHEPGTWEVSIRLDGYQEWRQRKTIGAGGSWIIDAKLEES